MIGIAGSGLEVAPALRSLRLIKLLRMHKAFQTRIFEPKMLLLRLGVIYFILAHYTGCIWWAMWRRVPNTVFAGGRQPIGYGPIESLTTLGFWDQYAVALYWGFSVLSGLELGEQVVAAGGAWLYEGMQVRPLADG